MQPVLDGPVATDDRDELAGAGLGHAQGGDRVAGLARPFPSDFAAAGDLDGPAGVREGQSAGHRSDLEGARLGAAMPAFPLVIGHRDVAPVQGGELVVQAGLVALDDQQVARAALVQVGCVAVLGVQSVCGDDGTGDPDTVQQRGEQEDFNGLGAYLDLAQYRAMSVIERDEQVPDGLLVTAGADPLEPGPTLAASI